VDNTNPLAQLKDIHLPAPVGWWPLAPGWYMLLGLILILTIVVVYQIYKWHRNALAKKKALLLLNEYQKQYEQNQNGVLTSALISELLRRVALVYYPRELVASMEGEQWLKFLNETSKKTDFNSVKELLLYAPFKSGETTDLKPLFHVAKLWIQQRRMPCSS
jgi:hypothetical protein